MAEWLYVLTPPRPTFAEDASEEEAAVMGEHFRYLQRLCEEGVVVLAGPSLDPAFGVVVFEAPDEDAARAIVEGDPSVARGLNTAQLHPFRVSLLRGR